MDYRYDRLQNQRTVELGRCMGDIRLEVDYKTKTEMFLWFEKQKMKAFGGSGEDSNREK